MSITCEVLIGLFVLFVIYAVLKLREAGEVIKKYRIRSEKPDEEKKK